MTDHESVVRRLREANPVPFLAVLPEDDLQAVRALLDRRRGKMATALPAPHPVPRWRRPALVLSAAFVVTLAAVGTTLLLLRNAEEAPPITSVTTTPAPTTTLAPSTTLAPTTTAGTTTTAPPATTTTVPAFPDALGMTWTRVADQESLHGGWMAGATAGGPGFVAVGGSMGAYDAAVWLSADGLTWERVTSDAFAGDMNQFGSSDGEQWMSDVVVGPQSLVAVGGDSQTGAAVWTSPDGRNWSRLPDDPAVFGVGGQAASATNWMQAVITGGPGLVAVGTVGNVGTVWASADGVEWVRAFSGEEWSWLTDVVAWEGRLYAVGFSGYMDRSQPSLDDPYRPIVLTSEDGLAWEALPQATVPGQRGVDFGTSWPEVQADLVALTPYEAELIGVSGLGWFGGNPAVWRSADGAAWVKTGGRFLNRQTDGGWPVDLLAQEGRLLAAFDNAEIWGSTDGGDYWFRIARFALGNGAGAPGGPALPVGAPLAYVHELLTAGGTVMAFGYDAVYSATEDIGGDVCWTGVMQCRADAAIWIGTFDQG